ncbi:MAG: pilus assembly protein PilM [Elusimicrobia bacterium]|nr:pilus assembly protein PilM [Elusimicrobiota bacterium]
MSKYDALIEQIAFGRETAKPATSLGLYLSTDMIYLSETHLGKNGRLAVDHLVRIPIPTEGKGPAGTATMSTDFLNDPAKVAGLVRQSMSQLRWNSKNVRVALSHHLGLLRYFAMPAVERRFLPSAVPLEAKKYIPIPFDVLAHDYKAEAMPPDAAGKARLGVLIAVTQKKNVENVKGLAAALGLKLAGLEVAPLSVLRMWQSAAPEKDPAPFVHVHIDGGSVRIMLVSRGEPVFFREVFLGEEATVADQRKIDLSGCLSFVQKQLGLALPTRLRVSGNVAGLDALMNALSQETGLPAALMDTPKLLGIKSGDWGGYAALGASAFSLAPAAGAIDLAGAERVTEDELRTARDIILAGGALAALLCVLGLWKSASYSYRARALYSYRAKVSAGAKSTLGGKNEADMQTILQRMQKQLDLLRTVSSGGQVKISVLLKEIIDAMPPQIWLDHISISNPLQAGDKQAFMVTLHGHSQSTSVSEEQTLVVRFKDALSREKDIGKGFDIQVSYENAQTPGGDSGATSGLTPAALANRLANRTQFTIVLTGKQ